jgi:hypothetical protein
MVTAMLAHPNNLNIEILPENVYQAMAGTGRKWHRASRPGRSLTTSADGI